MASMQLPLIFPQTDFATRGQPPSTKVGLEDYHRSVIRVRFFPGNRHDSLATQEEYPGRHIQSGVQADVARGKTEVS